MPWKCRLLDGHPGLDAQPGDMWFVQQDYLDENLFDFSAEYERDWKGKRLPLIVVLPNREPISIDGPYFDPNKPNPDRHGWTITGVPPEISVTPSINATGRYHGWLKDGVLSDDVDGRGGW